MAPILFINIHRKSISWQLIKRTSAALGSKTLESVTIPNTVTTIREYAFRYCGSAVTGEKRAFARAANTNFIAAAKDAGYRINYTVIQITITLSDGYTYPVICYVTTDGEVKILQSVVKDGKITFETDHTSYYVLVNQIKDTDDLPKTGDNTNLLLYIALTAFCASILMYMSTIKFYKKLYIFPK